MVKELELFEAVKSDPTVYLYRDSVERHGMSFDRLVSEAIMHSTEGVVNPILQDVIEQASQYVRRALQTCIANKMATKPATTTFGRFRKWLASLIAGKPVN